MCMWKKNWLVYQPQANRQSVKDITCTYREAMNRAKTDIPGVVVVHGEGLGQVGQPVGVVVSSLGEVVIVVVVDVIVARFFGG